MSYHRRKASAYQSLVRAALEDEGGWLESQTAGSISTTRRRWKLTRTKRDATRREVDGCRDECDGTICVESR